MSGLRHLLWMSVLLVAARNEAAADDTNADRSSIDFQREIRPLLVKHCGECHGSAKQESGLRIDHGTMLLAGGDSGPAIVAGKSAESLLIRRITAADAAERMPPEGPGVPAADVDRIRAWIDAGGKVPDDEPLESRETDHWAFKPLQRVTLPAVEDPSLPRNGIDHFIQAKIAHTAQTAGQPLRPSPPAPASTLLRRLSFDLGGLPPSADDVETWLADDAPDAWERLVDRTLASVSYGERWGRFWLDQARYADSNGYTRDFGREMWRYRDWVLSAINRDLPFDQFTIEQIAGDLLPEATLQQQVATGFHRNTLVNEEGGTDQEQFRVEAVADRVATTGSVWLGLTLGCARCHNHKYDPISQREFYQFFAFLNNCEEPSIEVPTQGNIERGDLARRDEIRMQIAQRNEQLEQQRPELEAKQREWEKTVTPEQRARLPGPVQVAYDMPYEKRDAMNKRLIEDHYRNTPEARRDFPLLEEIATLKESEPKIPTTLVLRERSEPRETHIHKRGDFLNLGVRVFPNTPTALPSLPAEPTGSTSSVSLSAPSRLTLAKWLVDAANPLTPRVTVNRHWLQFFGKGLVETEDDFGTQGTLPTHPELLDWLGRELLGERTESPWSLKRLHRKIVTSSTYRQSSRRRSEWETIDPRNDFLGRQVRMRVDAELVRDAALSASGLLTHRIGGPSVMPPQPDGVYAFTQDPKPWKAETGFDRYRRGLYTFFWRSLPFPMLTAFDAPNANVTCTRRIRSNTPLQSLTLANDLAFVECARQLARRVLTETSPSLEERTRYAFVVALGRYPDPAEAQRFGALVAEQAAAFDAAAIDELVGSEPLPAQWGAKEFAAWIASCRVLLNLDEFITRE